MSPIEIIVIVLVAGFVAFIFGKEIYKHSKGESSECSCCKSNMNRALKKAKKELKESNCCCKK